MKSKNNNELTKAKKILSFSFKILYDLLIIMCVLLIAVVVLQRITDSNKSVKGIRIFKVVSGSMVPKYDIGEVVICKEVDINTIEIGDAIVYKGKIGQLSNKIVMHEVVEINHNESGKLIFYAKGLNNVDEDPAVTEEQIYGVVLFKSTILTWLYAMATSIYSSFIIITILVLNVFISFNSGRFKRDSSKNKLTSGENQKEDSKDSKLEFVASIDLPNENVDEDKNEESEGLNQEKKEIDENIAVDVDEKIEDVDKKTQKKKDRNL